VGVLEAKVTRLERLTNKMAYLLYGNTAWALAAEQRLGQIDESAMRGAAANK
jgi:hypothetical protein